MVIKSLTYKNSKAFKHVVEYILKEADKDKPFLITRYVKDKNPEAIIKQFQANEELRTVKRKNNVLLNMDILSFHQDSGEALDDKILKDLVRKYISLKCPHSISCSVIHRDNTNHVHVHIVYGIEYGTGRAIRLSKSQFADIKAQTEAYQREKYPELFQSQVQHKQIGKAKIKQKEQAMELHNGKLSDKQKLIKDLESIFIKAQSKTDFFNRVKGLGYELYERGGNITGIQQKRKYRFKTLGYWNETLLELDQSLTKNKRLELLQQIRKRQEDHNRNRDRNR